jgi:hypothetical protein
MASPRCSWRRRHTGRRPPPSRFRQGCERGTAVRTSSPWYGQVPCTVVDRGMAEAGGAGEHQHREAVATRLGRWCRPWRLTATAAKHQDDRDRGDGDGPSDDAAAGIKELAAHGGQDASIRACRPSGLGSSWDPDEHAGPLPGSRFVACGRGATRSQDQASHRLWALVLVSLNQADQSG